MWIHHIVYFVRTVRNRDGWPWSMFVLFSTAVEIAVWIEKIGARVRDGRISFAAMIVFEMKSTIHLEFKVLTVSNTVLSAQAAFLHGLPIQNFCVQWWRRKFVNVSGKFPIRTTPTSGPTLSLRATNCLFVLSVQRFMPYVQSTCDEGPQR